jgi:hypothetical protein
MRDSKYVGKLIQKYKQSDFHDIRREELLSPAEYKKAETYVKLLSRFSLRCSAR